MSTNPTPEVLEHIVQALDKKIEMYQHECLVCKGSIWVPKMMSDSDPHLDKSSVYVNDITDGFNIVHYKSLFAEKCLYRVMDMQLFVSLFRKIEEIKYDEQSKEIVPILEG